MNIAATIRVRGPSQRLVGYQVSLREWWRWSSCYSHQKRAGGDECSDREPHKKNE